MTDDARLTDFVDGAVDSDESDAAGEADAAGESDAVEGIDAAGEADAAGESDAVEEVDAAGEADTAGDSDQVDDADSAEPPEAPSVTAEWTPEGALCGACGETVGRRWLDGDARVCADCKEW